MNEHADQLAHELRGVIQNILDPLLDQLLDELGHEPAKVERTWTFNEPQPPASEP